MFSDVGFYARKDWGLGVLLSVSQPCRTWIEDIREKNLVGGNIYHPVWFRVCMAEYFELMITVIQWAKWCKWQSGDINTALSWPKYEKNDGCMDAVGS